VIPVLRPDEIERYLAQLELAGCGLLWTGETNNDGYGRFPIWRDGKRIRILAHRLAWALFTGNDPGAFHLLHDCDIRLCCTPACLWPGTQRDNILDAIRKRRLDTSGLSAYRAIRIAQVAARENAAEKLCVRCRYVQSRADQFAPDERNPDGRSFWCLSCLTGLRAASSPMSDWARTKLPQVMT
jgi:HNH endonuclease